MTTWAKVCCRSANGCRSTPAPRELGQTAADRTQSSTMLRGTSGRLPMASSSATRPSARRGRGRTATCRRRARRTAALGRRAPRSARWRRAHRGRVGSTTRQMWSSRPSGVSPGSEVDDRVGVDPERREQHGAGAPFVDADRREAELVLYQASVVSMSRQCSTRWSNSVTVTAGAHGGHVGVVAGSVPAVRQLNEGRARPDLRGAAAGFSDAAPP